MSDQPEYRTPGQYIQALLESRGWTQKVLAIVLGVDESVINKIITGKRALDAELALGLSEVFSISAEQLLELQKTYDLGKARLTARPDPARNSRAHLFGSLPIPEMIKRGWINVDDIRAVPKVEAELMRFFDASSVDDIEILPHAAKKTNVAAEVSPAQLAWIYRVKSMAAEMLVGRFSDDAVRKAIGELKTLLCSADAVRKVPRILAEAGIRYVIVESLSSAKIDGVCFWLNDSSPVIGMSLRYDRIDNFWFVLRHELEHVLQGHGKSAVMLDAELEGERAGVGPSVAEEEKIANEAAADFCVPRRSLESFIARKAPFFAERDLVGFARTLQIHPGLVAGQLQRKTNRYDRFRNHLVKIRSAVAPSAMVDGWGDVAPVGI
jgi:HTH-type transcriptional regulator / antitoxin HigA